MFFCEEEEGGGVEEEGEGVEVGGPEGVLGLGGGEVEVLEGGEPIVEAPVEEGGEGEGDGGDEGEVEEHSGGEVAGVDMFFEEVGEGEV